MPEETLHRCGNLWIENVDSLRGQDHTEVPSTSPSDPPMAREKQTLSELRITREIVEEHE
jgi:hypothetical protein